MRRKYCAYCMTAIGDAEICPNCDQIVGSYVPDLHQLPAGTVLMDRYVLGRVIGEGGFGITYIGIDQRLELKVAVKEYYPVDCALRNTTVSTRVRGNTKNPERAMSFEKGKQKFLREARTAAHMEKQQVMVSVRDFFEENDTAYIVMEYIEGTTLKQLAADCGGRIPYNELFVLLEPLFGALAEFHEQGLIHRDISPDNIMLENGRVRLLDFGCAKNTNIREETFTISVKHGFAPFEQYQLNGAQGPYSDVYSLAATIYYCITGITPPQPFERLSQDTLVPPSELGIQIGKKREEALMKALAIMPKERYATATDMWADLYADGRTRGGAVVFDESMRTLSIVPETEVPEEKPKPRPMLRARETDAGGDAGRFEELTEQIRVKFGTREPIPFVSPEMPSVPMTATAHGVVTAETVDSDINRSFICDAAVLMLNDLLGQYSGNVRSSYIRSKIPEMNRELSAGLERKLHFKCSVSMSSVNVSKLGETPSAPAVQPAGLSLRSGSGDDSSARPKFCPNCGSPLSGGAKFCANCGKPV